MKLIKLLLFFSILASLIFLLGYYQIIYKTKKEKNNLNILKLATKNIDSRDPIFCKEYNEKIEVLRVYETLYSVDPFSNDIKYIPLLAKKMPNFDEEKMSFKITLKENIFFHHNKCFGTKRTKMLTVDDVIYSIKRALVPQNKNKAYFQLKDKIKDLEKWYNIQKKLKKPNFDLPIESIKKIDDFNFEIIVTSPYININAILSQIHFAIVPREAIEFYKNKFSDNPVGTGPYIGYPKNKVQNTYLYLKNSKYNTLDLKSFIKEKKSQNKHLEEIKKIEVKIVKSDEETINLFLFGKIDIIFMDSNVLQIAKDYKNLIAKKIINKNFYIIKSSSLFYTSLGFNLKEYPFNIGPKFRRLISLAIDTKKINLLNHPYNKQTESLIPLRDLGVDTQYMSPYFTFDFERAKQMLSEIKIKKNIMIKLDTIDNKYFKLVSRIIKISLESLGIKTKIIFNSEKQLKNKIKNGKYMIYLMDSLWEININQVFEKYLSLTNINKFNYKNKKYDQLYKKLYENEKNNETYDELNHLLSEDLPEISLNMQQKILLAHAWINVYINTYSYDLSKYYLIDTTKKYKQVMKNKINFFNIFSYFTHDKS